MIQFFDVVKRYPQGVEALRGISLHIPKGGLVYLTGESGAGKSTFLKLIYGGETLTTGGLIVGGRNLDRITRRRLADHRRTLGVVFQDYKLLYNMSVFENVALTLEVAGTPPKQIKDRVMQVLERMGVQRYAKASPITLSGGEQQRVALARAIVHMPNLILADEPTGNLDPDHSHKVMETLQEQQARGCTIIVATHNWSLINKYAHPVVHLHEGKIARKPQWEDQP
ncbi:MAG: cell division ATP-binding protein FtsE [Alphaproteobacteria bacterium CG_4_10_14_0_2_um_filter_63_37]|nr:MAG: cell division ATP-binding protein FtsE [Proteobacteria bacterium CG1_02_64_396]PJA25639.1 MAG: cell division ATP-binding protein FtsE [Alphaproteobacteria bacterium CG_4_10_14_0_2_um_filter_63_37]